MPLTRLATLLVFVTSACFPAITHGPNIDPGFAVGVTASATTGPGYTEGDEGGIKLRQGIAGVHLSNGWVSADSTDPRFYAALELPLPLATLVQADLFAQLPPAITPHFSLGMGVNLSVDSRAYYAQVGHINSNGNGWFLTHGMSYRKPSEYYSTSVASISGAAIQLTSGRVRTYVFTQYAKGRIPGRCQYDPSKQQVCLPGNRSHSLAAGITLERRSRKQERPTR